MSPSEKLFAAYSRIKRAKKHIEDLDVAIRAFQSTSPNKIGSKHDPNSRRLIYYVKEMRAIPAEISLIAGDCIHCLRSALDYVAYQLWLACGGMGNVKNVSFPIFDDSTKFNAGIANKLNYYRLEAGRFEDFVSYGLKSFAHEGVT